MADNIIFRPGTEEPVSVVAEACNETHHVQYLGYARRGTKNLDEANFCILRIACDKATGITTYQWSNGSLQRNVAFSERENIDYQFLI